jgi:hypothetical protein
MVAAKWLLIEMLAVTFQSVIGRHSPKTASQSMPLMVFADGSGDRLGPARAWPDRMATSAVAAVCGRIGR